MNKNSLWDVLGIILGSVIFSLGINVFLLPNEIAAGGVSGLATVFYLTFGVPLSVTVLVLNGLLFLAGFAFLSRWELVKSLLGVVFMSFFLEITEKMPVYREDMLISALAGGVLCGIGIGITVSRGASTGGSDMLGLMICRKIRHISVANVMLIADGAVILISGFAFSSVTVMLYAVLAAYVCARVADYISIHGESAKQIHIISRKWEIISEKIIKEIGRGATGFYTKGMYTGTDGMSVMCMVSRREARRVIDIVYKTDKDAFVTTTDVREVLGKGFKVMGE